MAHVSMCVCQCVAVATARAVLHSCRLVKVEETVTELVQTETGSEAGLITQCTSNQTDN